MLYYVLRRFGYMVVTIWVIITLTFIMMHAIPGDPFLSEKKTSEVTRRNLRAKYGLDKPYHEQYVIWVKNLLKGELGVSMKYVNRTVNDMIREGFPKSARLGLLALAYALSLGLTLGIIASLNHNRWPDYFSVILAVIGVAVPSFVFGTLLQYLLGVKWRLVPVAGWGTFRHMLLPAMVLGFGTLAVTARMMRSSMLDVLSQDYIKTAKAKGLSGGEVVWRHALRNALLPIVTILGPLVVNITTGSLIIEQVFAIPGLGKYFVQSIVDSDYTLIMGTTIFYATLLVVAMFLVDVAYGFVDPRIRLVKARK